MRGAAPTTPGAAPPTHGACADHDVGVLQGLGQADGAGLARHRLSQGPRDAPSGLPVHAPVGRGQQVIDGDAKRPAWGRAHRALMPSRLRMIVEQRGDARRLIRSTAEAQWARRILSELQQAQIMEAN
jgi:hypothetical protein